MLNKVYVSPHEDVRLLLTNIYPETPSGQYRGRPWGTGISEFGKTLCASCLFNFPEAFLRCIPYTRSSLLWCHCPHRPPPGDR